MLFGETLNLNWCLGFKWLVLNVLMFNDWWFNVFRFTWSDLKTASEFVNLYIVLSGGNSLLALSRKQQYLKAWNIQEVCYASYVLYCFPYITKLCALMLWHQGRWRGSSRSLVCQSPPKIVGCTLILSLSVYLYVSFSVSHPLSLSFFKPVLCHQHFPGGSWAPQHRAPLSTEQRNQLNLNHWSDCKERFLRPEPEPGPWTLEPKPGSAFRGETQSDLLTKNVKILHSN